MSSSSSQSASDLTKRLEEIRNTLIDTSIYLGVEDTLDDLTWFKFGNEDRLVIRQEAESFDAANKASELDPDAFV